MPSGPTITISPGSHIVQIDRVDQIEGAGFRSEHVAGAPPDNSIWPMASGRNPCGSRATMMRSSARNTSENAPSSCSSASRSAPASVRSRECATRCRITSVSLEAWKMEPRAFQFRAQFGGVGDVAVVRHRDAAFVARHRKRLRVQQHRIAGGRIARMADGQIARAASASTVAGENIGHVAHGFVAVDLARRRWSRCRRSPARDAAAHTGPDRPDWRLPDGRKWRRRRTPRGIYQTWIVGPCMNADASERDSLEACFRLSIVTDRSTLRPIADLVTALSL